MAKLDWKKLEQAFRREHAKTGIKLQEWCRQKKLWVIYKTRKNPHKNRESAQKMRKKVRKLTQKTAQKNAHGSDEEPSNDGFRR